MKIETKTKQFTRGQIVTVAAHRLMDDVTFRGEHDVPSISTINRIIRLSCSVDGRHADDTVSHQAVRAQ